jgi:hypothetical protein
LIASNEVLHSRDKIVYEEIRRIVFVRGRATMMGVLSTRAPPEGPFKETQNGHEEKGDESRREETREEKSGEEEVVVAISSRSAASPWLEP